MNWIWIETKTVSLWTRDEGMHTVADQ